MIWSAGSVWWGRRVAYCDLGPQGWSLSTMMSLPSPDWSFGVPSGLPRSCLQRDWQFRPSAVICRSRSSTLSFMAGRAVAVQTPWRLHGSHLEWKVFRSGSQFCGQQCGADVKQAGTLRFSAYLAFWESWFGRRDRWNSTKVNLLRTCLLFTSTKSKWRSGFSERVSFRWCLAKGGWLLVGAIFIFTLDTLGFWGILCPV